MKNLIEVQIGGVWVEGEVSNLRKQGSGHWYFSLKDEGAQISCAMFGAARRDGADALADGAKVRVFAEPSVYEARGQLQIIVLRAERAGLGELQARFEALKNKLLAEGLFDVARKKVLPGFPRKIGVVTSETGAALQDMLHVFARRAPWVTVVLFPVRVQGRGAELEIARAVEMMSDAVKHGLPVCDLLIVGRGGGSLEDLWNFNEEIVARAIAACALPVISAVGHEIDFTIADFVADVRAPTPSAAAELAVPDFRELQERLATRRQRMERLLIETLATMQRRLENCRRGPLAKETERMLQEPVMRLDRLRERLDAVIRPALDSAQARCSAATHLLAARTPAHVLARRTETLAALHGRMERTTNERFAAVAAKLETSRGMLRTLGPELTFERGFSMTIGADGKAVKSAVDLKEGEVLTTKFAHGSAESKVTAVRDV